MRWDRLVKRQHDGGVREELAATTADLGCALRGKAEGFEGERCPCRLPGVEWR